MTWQPIETAPKDGTEVWVYAPPYQDLQAMQCCCNWHADAGWCVDELRQPTHWVPLEAVELPPPGASSEIDRLRTQLDQCPGCAHEPDGLAERGA